MRKWLKAKVEFHFYKKGNCWKFWALPSVSFRWSGKLFYINWWRIQFTLDRRGNLVSELLEVR